MGKQAKLFAAGNIYIAGILEIPSMHAAISTSDYVLVSSSSLPRNLGTERYEKHSTQNIPLITSIYYKKFLSLLYYVIDPNE